MNDEAEPLLRDLFTKVESDVSQITDSNPSRVAGTDGAPLIYFDEAFRVLVQLREMLAEPALDEAGNGGLHPDAVVPLIDEACARARDEGADAAVNWLRQKVDSPAEDFWIAISLPAHFDAPNLALGRCELVKQLPDDAMKQLRTEVQRREVGSGAYLATTVQAREERSAEIRARDAFDEARSLLRMIAFDAARDHTVPSHIWGRNGQYGLSDRITETWIVRGADASGVILPGYRHLGEAMAKPTAAKTDWEKRTIGACRWYHRAMMSEWPSASLGACFSALETLLLDSDERYGKGEKVAERVAARVSNVRGKDLSDVADWLKELYYRRNDAVHESILYANELEVARLEELVRASVAWAAHHLDPDHRTPASACSTYAEALDTHPTA